MISLNNILEIGKTGLLAHKARMSVTSHNIVNVNTPGYHRQRVQLGTQPPLDVGTSTTWKITFGAGVKILDIVRNYDMMMEDALNGEISSSANHDQLAKALEDAQGLLEGTGDYSLAECITEFWNSWQDVANNADTLAYRSVLLEKADAMCTMFNDMYARLNDYRGDICTGTGASASGAVERNVSEINSLADRIADLNQKIAIMASRDNDVNDMLDERDMLVRDLAEITNIDFTRESDSTYTITIDGQTLVSASTSNHVSITSDDPIALELDGAAITPTGGEISGWLNATNVFEDIMNKLDTLSLEIVGQVNAVHVGGYDLDGNTGIDFFSGATSGASDISIDALMQGNPRSIAAAATVHSLGPPVIPNVGDGANALAIADLGEQKFAALDNRSFHAYYTDMLSELGTDIITEKTLADHGNSVVDMINNTLMGQTGVNLDEELIEMMSAQRAYAASAKVISVADDMLDTVINRM